MLAQESQKASINQVRGTATTVSQLLRNLYALADEVSIYPHERYIESEPRPAAVHLLEHELAHQYQEDNAVSLRCEEQVGEHVADSAGTLSEHVPSHFRLNRATLRSTMAA